MKRQDRSAACCLTDTCRQIVHFLLLDHERDDPRPGKLVALSDRCVSMPRGDHHLGCPVDQPQRSRINLEQAVTVSRQLDLPFLWLARAHMRADCQIPQDGSRLIFMEHAFLLLPDIEILLPDAQKHRDIFLCNDMPLAECGTLECSRNDLRHIVAQHRTFRIDCPDQLHLILSSPVLFSVVCSPAQDPQPVVQRPQDKSKTLLHRFDRSRQVDNQCFLPDNGHAS